MSDYGNDGYDMDDNDANTEDDWDCDDEQNSYAKQDKKPKLSFAQKILLRILGESEDGEEDNDEEEKEDDQDTMYNERGEVWDDLIENFPRGNSYTKGEPSGGYISGGKLK